MSKQRLYLTTPLYYVNDEPHIGHAYTTLLADVMARYHRLFGRDVHFLTGTDEHGQKVQDAAKKLGRSPQEHCDITAQRFVNVWDKLNVEYDDFIRTTEPRHEKVVVEILQQLYDEGEIYKEDYEGYYSVTEERFFTEKDLVDGKDPIGGRPVEKIKESNYFFRMSKHQQWLLEFYESHPDAVLPEFRMNEVKGFLQQPLGDLCISRPKSRLSWGIPIPWDEDYVTYVWFDALLNYYAATVSPPEGSSPAWPADYHLIGKDILTTHAVYWPTMLHAAGLEPPRHILAHGWWLSKDAEKMSKSRGNVVKPLDMADIYGPDLFRYVLMRDMVVGQDANFSEEMFVKRINSDLANDLGNLASRITKLIDKFFDGVVPEADALPEDELPQLAERTAHIVFQKVEGIQIHAAIEETLQFVRAANRIFTEGEPWKTVKQDREAAGRTLSTALEAVRIAAVLLQPVLPNKANELLERIGADADIQYSWDDTKWGTSLEGRKLTHGDAVFPRVEKPKPPKAGETKPAKKDDEQKTEDDYLSFDQFKQVDLRSAKVLHAEPVPKTDKLLRLEIEVGEEKRQLVAGVAQHYAPEEMIGRTIVIVANLQPAKIRGVESQGMLLAVRDGDSLNLLTPGDVKSGLRVS
ncbi:methionine--tRNA ligase [bacterium]|nr:methionine--tRNA ligase [bacterium]